MGKNLIVKGADFRENGFHVTVTKTTLTTLYFKDGTEYDNTFAHGSNTVYYTYATNGNKLVNGSALDMSLTNKIDLTDYPNAISVNVDTKVQLGYYNSGTAGLIILAFLDEDEKLISGYCTSETSEQIGSNLNLVPMGASNDLRELRDIPVPANAKYILAPWSTSRDGAYPANAYKVEIIEESVD